MLLSRKAALLSIVTSVAIGGYVAGSVLVLILPNPFTVTSCSCMPNYDSDSPLPGVKICHSLLTVSKIDTGATCSSLTPPYTSKTVQSHCLTECTPTANGGGACTGTITTEFYKNGVLIGEKVYGPDVITCQYLPT